MTTESRIEQLEMKIAFQDDNIETLNNEIFEQQRKLQVLTEQVTYLVAKLKETESDDGGIDQVDMRPPHY
ncbi:MAG: SlyX family protein [Psychromonas sp.]